MEAAVGTVVLGEHELISVMSNNIKIDRLIQFIFIIPPEFIGEIYPGFKGGIKKNSLKNYKCNNQFINKRQVDNLPKASYAILISVYPYPGGITVK